MWGEQEVVGFGQEYQAGRGAMPVHRGIYELTRDCEPGECFGVCDALVTFWLCQPREAGDMAGCACVWCES